MKPDVITTSSRNPEIPPVPSKPWITISIDFIMGLPWSEEHYTIWVVVDRLTKM
jgi:hypothetical protein